MSQARAADPLYGQKNRQHDHMTLLHGTKMFGTWRDAASIQILHEHMGTNLLACKYLFETLGKGQLRNYKFSGLFYEPFHLDEGKGIHPNREVRQVWDNIRSARKKKAWWDWREHAKRHQERLVGR
jgi:hypothetical protein